MNKGALKASVNNPEGYGKAVAILSSLGLDYVEPASAKFF